MDKTAIVIGAGLGGMATAIRLARQGWQVKVLEKNTRVGGKLDCHCDHGFLWDMGPSTITMPFVLRELFEYAGHDIEDYLELIPVDPVCRYFYPDGKVVNTWSNYHHFQIEVARREKDHGESMENFMRYARGVYDFSGEVNLFRLPATWLGCLGIRFLKKARHLPKVLTRKTMAQTIEHYFKDPHTRQLFLHYATCQGSSPYQAHATLNVLPYLELQDGSWYIRGGIYRLAEALEKCARDLGVEFQLDAEISEITLKGQGAFRKPRATGVVIRGGMHLDASVIVCNADMMHAWTRLLHTKRQAAITRQFDQTPFSNSAFMLLLGIKRRYDKLAHHNVFFSSDYLAEFDDLFHKRRPAAEPTIYVCISGRTDPTQSPAGEDNYFVVVNAPALEQDHHWERMRDSYRNVVLDRLEKMGLEDLKNQIVYEKIITPSDFASRNNAYRGAIYSHAAHSLETTWNRQPNRCKEINGLYFVGGSVQPGGGIPMVLLSARKAAETVVHDSV